MATPLGLKLVPIGLVEEEGEFSNVRVFPEFSAGLNGLEAFSHVIVLYWLHGRDNHGDRATLEVTPRRHVGAPRIGVFACRSPSRPNPVGLSVAEIVGISGALLRLRGLDALRGSPIIDLKPYLPRADAVPHARVPLWALRGPST